MRTENDLQYACLCRQAFQAYKSLMWVGALLFLSVAGAQAQGLQLVESNPQPHQVDADLSGGLTLDFNRPIDGATLSTESVRIYGSVSGVVESMLFQGGGTEVIDVQMNHSFVAGELVTVVLTDHIRDDTGNALDPAVTLEFIIATDGGGRLSEEMLITNPADFLTYARVEDMKSADIDGDGSPDVVVAGNTNMLWFRNIHGDSLTWGATSMPFLGTLRHIETGDLDDDGDLDVIGSSYSGGYIFWYENEDGLGNMWKVHTITNEVIGISQPAVVDLDRDGDLDVAASGMSESGTERDAIVFWFENADGDGQNWIRHEVRRISYNTADTGYNLSYEHIEVADLDGDQDPDLILQGGEHPGYVWFENTGGDASTWSEHRMADYPVDAFAIPLYHTLGDVDGDGDLDLLTVRITAFSYPDRTTTFSWHEQLEDGSVWVEHQAIHFKWLVDGLISYPHPADIDGDGDLDVVTYTNGPEQVAVIFENEQGDGSSWTVQPFIARDPYPRFLDLADVDQDGTLDVVTHDGTEIIWFRGTSPFKLIDRSPAANSITAEFASNLVFTFNQPVDEASVTPQSLTLHGSFSGAESYTLTGGNTTQLTVEGGVFRHGEEVTVTLGDSIKSVEGTPLAKPITYRYTVAAERPTEGLFGKPLVISDSVQGPIDLVPAGLNHDLATDVLVATHDDGRVIWYENVLSFEDVQWVEHTLSTGAPQARYVYAADLDGDGDSDVLVASAADNAVHWHENLVGDGSDWRARPITLDALGASDVAAADLDGDGDVDVVVSSVNNTRVAWYENAQGDGSVWTPHPVDDAAGDATTIAIADLDGDDDFDLVAAAKDAGTYTAYENTQGDGSAWVKRGVGPRYETAADVAAAPLFPPNMNILGAAPEEDKLLWFLNVNGDGSTWSEGGEWVGPVQRIAATDIDGDARLEVLVATDDDEISWYDVGVSTPHQVSTKARGTTALQAADIDFDGDMDVVAALATSGQIVWYPNHDPLRLIRHTPPANTVAPPGVQRVFLGFDRAVDLTTLNQETIKLHGSQSGPMPFTVTQSPVGFSVLDPSQPFKAGEIVTVTLTEQVKSESQNGSRVEPLEPYTFRYTIASGETTMDFDNAHLISDTVPGVDQVTPADVDGDGDLDLVAASQATGFLTWIENAGQDTETWITHPIVDNLRGLYQLVPADMDDDGDLDLLVSHGPIYEIAWFENNGTNFWAYNPVRSDLSAEAVGIAAADADGDGDLDVIAGMAREGSSAWHENKDGVGTEWEQHLFAAPASRLAADVYLTEFDYDGALDVVAVRSDSISLYLNKEKDGSAWTEEDLLALSQPLGVIGGADVVDLNGDDYADFVYGDLSNGEVRWLSNSSNFWHEQPKISSDSAYVLRVADMDGDGLRDVVTAAASLVEDDRIYVYQQIRRGNDMHFEPAEVDREALVSDLQAADLDGDGDLDLVAALTDSDQVVWYPNWDPLLLEEHTPAKHAIRVDRAAPIRLEFDRAVDMATVSEASIKLHGAQSGYMFFNVTSPQENVIEITPGFSFDVGEEVTLTVTQQVKAKDNGEPLQTPTTIRYSVASLNAYFDFDEPRLISGVAQGVLDLFIVEAGLHTDGPEVLTSDRLGNVWWYTEDTDSTWTSEQLASTGVAIYPGDLDGDAWSDIVMLSESGEISWLENGDGAGWFKHPIRTYPGSFGTNIDILTADLDGDGDLDVAATTGKNLVWLENEAGDASQWTSHILAIEQGDINQLQAADVNVDGSLDLVAVVEHPEEQTEMIKWYRNDRGNGTRWSDFAVAEGLSHVEDFYMAEMSDDRYIDLVVTLPEVKVVRWYQNTTSQGLTWVPYTVDDDLAVHSVYVADPTGIGVNEIVAASTETETVQVYAHLQEQKTTWVPFRAAPSLPAAGRARTADMDGDGDLDLIAASAEAGGQLIWYRNDETLSDWITSASFTHASGSAEALDVYGTAAEAVAASKTETEAMIISKRLEAASMTLATSDLTLLADDLAFGETASFTVMPNTMLYIAPSTSTGPQDALATFEPLLSTEQALITLAGLSAPNGYAPNPDGSPLDLKLAVAAVPDASTAGTAVVLFTHAVTDASSVDVRLADGTVLATGLGFGRTSAPVELPTGAYAFEFVDPVTNAVLATVIDQQVASSLALTFAGFLDPAANQGGPAAHVVAAPIGVHNEPPVILGLSLPGEAQEVGTEITGLATFEDPNQTVGHTAVWDWGDGTTSEGVVSEAEGTITGQHTYNVVGVYTVEVTISDAEFEASATYQYVVTYDPTAGFVTGGGWIQSPAGAHPAQPELDGKLTFGFVAKYKKNSTVPEGNLQIQFQAASLEFQSSSFEWLVLNETHARLKGTGTIHGSGTYGFLLTAADAATDRFRIKIWDQDAADQVVYDSQPDAPEEADPTTELGGGSIKIHSQQGGALGKGADGFTELPAKYELRQNYPNPFNPETTIAFALPEAGQVQLIIYDILGREVRRLVDGPLSAGQHAVQFVASDLASGTYLYRIQAGAYTSVRRLVLLK